MKPMVIELPSYHQEGRTTVGLGILERVEKMGFNTICIVPTSDRVRHLRDKTTVRCVPASAFEMLCGSEPVSAIFIDDARDIEPLQRGELIARVKDKLSVFPHATQLIIAY